MLTTSATIMSCDTLVALDDSTAGGVLLAKNSDRSPHEAQRLIGVPAARYAPGATVRCQYITIPQVERTAALIGAQPYWLWGFEHGLNEHGVAIGNEAIFTREAPCESGLLGMDLVRLGLERGTTARAALEAITGLLEQFGQGGSTAHHALAYYDNSFLIADPREAWVLETCGRRWVARHLTHGTYAISNRPTIGTEFDLASDDLIAYAEERGWWPRGRRPFDFAVAYTDPDSSGLEGAACRLARSRRHLAAGAVAPLGAADLMAALRDHGTPPAGQSWLAWPTGHEPATLCSHGLTAGSMVAHLVPGDSPATAAPTYWASLVLPCTGIFIPCWVDAGPPPEMARADEEPHAASPWWRYRRLWETVAAAPDPAALVRAIRSAWAPLEESALRHAAALGPSAPVERRRILSRAAFAESLHVLARLEAELVDDATMEAAEPEPVLVPA